MNALKMGIFSKSCPSAGDITVHHPWIISSLPGVQPSSAGSRWTFPKGFCPCLWALRALCWCHCSSALGHRNCLTLHPVNPTSSSCWTDSFSLLEKEREINHIAACGMGQVSLLSLCLLPWHYRISWRVLCSALCEITFSGVVEFLGILSNPVEICGSCL